MESRRSNMVVQEDGVTYVRANPAAPFTAAEKARRFAMVATAGLAIAAVCLLLGGYGTQAPRASLAAKHAAIADPMLHRTTRLDDEAEAAPTKDKAPAESSGSSMPKIEIPDPEETTRKAKEAMAKARSVDLIFTFGRKSAGSQHVLKQHAARKTEKRVNIAAELLARPSRRLRKPSPTCSPRGLTSSMPW